MVYQLYGDYPAKECHHYQTPNMMQAILKVQIMTWRKRTLVYSPLSQYFGIKCPHMRTSPDYDRIVVQKVHVLQTLKVGCTVLLNLWFPNLLPHSL